MLLAPAIAILISVLAFAAGSLTLSGAVAAAVVGALCILAGWSWGALLVVYFVVAVACSKLGSEAKDRRTGGVVAKGGQRDAQQVLANGGVYATAAFLSTRMHGASATLLAAAALGALAAASADTLATEIGTLLGGEPRSLIRWNRVPAGTSGGITVAGTLGMLAGALLVAGAAYMMMPEHHAVAAATGGVIGALADSLLGALAQERRHCPRCDSATERLVHDCGTATAHAGGLAWLDNDLVNLAATIVGAVVAATLVVV